MKNDVKHANQLKLHEKEYFEVVMTYGRKENLDEIKNIAGQVLTYNSKKFHRINKKLDIEQTMSELGKPFLKNQIKNKKNRKSMSKCC